MFFDSKDAREWDDYLGYIYTCECLERKRSRVVDDFVEEEEEEEMLCFVDYDEEPQEEEYDVWTGKY